MRILNILSGIAVLFTTLAFAHLLHHFSTHAPHESFRDPAFMGGMAAGVVVGILSFIGACLLLRRCRSFSPTTNTAPLFPTQKCTPQPSTPTLLFHWSPPP